MPHEGRLPSHIGPGRVWKARKRRELRALEKAVWTVMCGAHFTPMRDVGIVLSKVREWRKACSAKEWGR